MYSPKIREDLVGPLYQLAKARKVPMTRLVNEVLAEYLRRADGPGPDGAHAPDAPNATPPASDETPIQEAAHDRAGAL